MDGDSPRRVAAGGDAPKVPLVSAGDVGLVIGLPLLALTAWLTPPRVWHSLASAVSPFAGAILSRSPREIASCVAAFAGDRAIAMAGDAVARALVAAEIESGFQAMRDHLPAGWRPAVELIGKEHVESALRHGSGAIIWDSHFYYAAMVTKMAMQRHGYGLYHLSHPRHGFSPTRFAMRFLNPIRTASEARYVEKRIVLSLDGSVGAMRLLLKHLRSNGVVSVTVRDTGLRACEVPFLDGSLRVATGASDLAYASGAALIPVFTVRHDGRYVVTAEAPIEIDSRAPRREAAVAAVEAYARRLEPHVLAYPGQWVGWLNL